MISTKRSTPAKAARSWFTNWLIKSIFFTFYSFEEFSRYTTLPANILIIFWLHSTSHLMLYLGLFLFPFLWTSGVIGKTMTGSDTNWFWVGRFAISSAIAISLGAWSLSLSITPLQWGVYVSYRAVPGWALFAGSFLFQSRFYFFLFLS